MYICPHKGTCLMRYLRLCLFVVLSFLSVTVKVSAESQDSVLLGLYGDSMEKGDVPDAMDAAAVILSRIDSASVDVQTAVMAEDLAEYLDKAFRYSEALRWRSLASAGYGKSPEHRQDYARNELELAKLYYRTGTFHKAFVHVNNAMDVYSEGRENKEHLECVNLLGALYYACRDYDMSSDYFRQCAKGAESTRDTSMLLLALNNMAVYIYSQSDSVETKKLLLECAELCRQSGNTSFLSKVYINISLMSIRSKDFDAARRYLDAARPILTDVGENGQYYYYSAIIDYRQGNLDAAIVSLHKAVDLYSLGEFGERRQACLELLQEIYAVRGDYENAYNTLFNYYTASKQYDREGAVIELFKVQNEKLLNEQREEELSRKRALAVWLSVSVFLLVLISVLAVMMYKRREYEIRRREQELAARKEIEELKQMQQYKTDCLVNDTIENLNRLGARMKDEELQKELARICGDLKDTKKRDEWMEIKSFVPKFESDFYRNLIQAYPSLTLNERRLCVFLNMSLTTKEISDITRQSVQSINTARGRLRRKLGINGDNISMQEFLSKFN